MAGSVKAPHLQEAELNTVSSSSATAHSGHGPSSSHSWREHRRVAPTPAMTRNKTPEMEDYFVGPRDMARHSKWPFFMRMHGSVLPRMIVPLVVVTGWSTAITLISQLKYPLTVDNLLLTVLGFVVAMAISFRTSSAYERYAEGRKYWAQMLLVGQNLARTIWLHSKEREGEIGKEDLLEKITALNLIVSFAKAVKHKLRFEPGIDYDDMRDMVGYLDTFAKAAEEHIPKGNRHGVLKNMGQYLDVSFAESNPRKRLKQAKKPLGNLPLEILSHLSTYVDSLITNGTLSVPLYQNQCITGVVTLNETLVGLERILQTPLPIAYSIAISQITWAYILVLPFQLWDTLRWVTIPGTIFAAYIILGINAIGREIENPFGHDVNDLPLDSYCEELASDVDIIASMARPSIRRFMHRPDNKIMWPLSETGWDGWCTRDKGEIREALLTKTRADMAVRRSFSGPERSSHDEKGHSLLHAGHADQGSHPPPPAPA